MKNDRLNEVNIRRFNTLRKVVETKYEDPRPLGKKVYFEREGVLVKDDDSKVYTGHYVCYKEETMPSNKYVVLFVANNVNEADGESPITLIGICPTTTVAMVRASYRNRVSSKRQQQLESINKDDED